MKIDGESIASHPTSVNPPGLALPLLAADLSSTKLSDFRVRKQLEVEPSLARSERLRGGSGVGVATQHGVKAPKPVASLAQPILVPNPVLAH